MPIKAMVDGIWHPQIEDSPAFRARRVEERKRAFHGRITTDGETGFPAEPGRYHLYVSYACPWAHKTVIYRSLKGLRKIVPMSVLDPRWSGPNGWTFGNQDDATTGITRDHANGFAFLHEVYRQAKPDFTGKVTVPVLFDRKTGTIVSNESSEIIRMFDDAFAAIAPETPNFRPERLRPAIEALNGFVLDRICLGVYRAGFADDQASYDKAVGDLFGALDEMEARLADRDFLFAGTVTETDRHLFATLIRFDAVYHGALRCNLRRLVDHPNLWTYTRRLYALPGVAATVRLDHVKRHYYDDLGLVDPTIVPAGPALEFGTAKAAA
ncbi:MAG: glutathione S-transferase family protein [Alphaproteobacteria bacterium]|nr:glutathione S-transferase family protein [Alphaproteobacteria bacterium]